MIIGMPKNSIGFLGVAYTNVCPIPYDYVANPEIKSSLAAQSDFYVCLVTLVWFFPP